MGLYCRYLYDTIRKKYSKSSAMSHAYDPRAWHTGAGV